MCEANAGMPLQVQLILESMFFIKSYAPGWIGFTCNSPKCPIQCLYVLELVLYLKSIADEAPRAESALVP